MVITPLALAERLCECPTVIPSEDDRMASTRNFSPEQKQQQQPEHQGRLNKGRPHED
jgi:hypothetical protein